MSRLRRNIFRIKLDDYLSRSDDAAFFVMAWSAMAVQDERAEHARPFLKFPKEAITTQMSSTYKVHPWKLESLLNELLTVPKLPILPNKRNRRVDCRQFAALAQGINLLSKLEGAEDGLTLKKIHIFREMHRLGQRQFEWQRGFVSISQFYKAAFIYGGALTKQYFTERNSFSIDDFMYASFALLAMFQSHPMIKASVDFSQFGIPSDKTRLIIEHLSLEHSKARRAASVMRRRGGHTGYKPSLLRKYPCISFVSNGIAICAPLPDLLILRSTSGIFYDVINGGDHVKNEISNRFETYTFEYLQAMLHSREVRRSFKYPYRRNNLETPDILVYEANEVAIVFECKATRLSYEARFSEDPLATARRGYEEMAKAIFQVWRFASHCRRAIVPRTRLKNNVTGIVVTLDTWLTMANIIQDDVFELARTIAAQRDAEIIDIDQIPVNFCPIDELERTLTDATDDSFFAAVDASATAPFKGWLLGDVHREVTPDVHENNGFPFHSRILEVLPWLGQGLQAARLDLRDFEQRT